MKHSVIGIYSPSLQHFVLFYQYTELASSLNRATPLLMSRKSKRKLCASVPKIPFVY